jgi:hypothetical protein
VSEPGTAGACADGVGLDNVVAVAVSPDGRSVYAVAVLDRNVSNGDLAQKVGTAGCASDSGTGGACADAQAMNGVSRVAVAAARIDIVRV